jgi:hypothetical protein
MLGLIGSVAVLVGVWAAWRVVHFYAFGIDNAYAQWGAADMVIDFMEKHHGRWPRSWEDLRGAFEAGGGRVGGWSFEKYRSRIWIDWDVEPRSLEAAAVQEKRPSFDVIHPADGINVHIGDMEANQLLYRYFRQKAGGKSSQNAKGRMQRGHC